MRPCSNKHAYKHPHIDKGTWERERKTAQQTQQLTTPHFSSTHTKKQPQDTRTAACMHACMHAACMGAGNRTTQKPTGFELLGVFEVFDGVAGGLIEKSRNLLQREFISLNDIA